MKVSDALVIVNSATRDSANDSWSQDDKHQALRFVLDEFIRHSRQRRTRSTFNFPNAVAEIAVSVIHSELRARFLHQIYFTDSQGANRAFTIRDEAFVRRLMIADDTTGRPRYGCFPDDDNMLWWPTCDQQYGATASHSLPMGDLSNLTTTIDMPDEQVRGCCWRGVVTLLRYQSYMEAMASPDWQAFELWARGEGGSEQNTGIMERDPGQYVGSGSEVEVYDDLGRPASWN